MIYIDNIYVGNIWIFTYKFSIQIMVFFKVSSANSQSMENIKYLNYISSGMLF